MLGGAGNGQVTITTTATNLKSLTFTFYICEESPIFGVLAHLHGFSSVLGSACLFLLLLLDPAAVIVSTRRAPSPALNLPACEQLTAANSSTLFNLRTKRARLLFTKPGLVHHGFTLTRGPV